MKEIQLTQGKVAIVDDEDFEYLNQWKWQACKKGYVWYAERTTEKSYIKKHYKMHREIMKPADGVMIDHVNGDGLDNRKSNLRFCNKSQNYANCRVRSDNSTGYKGVTYDKKNKKFAAKMVVGDVNIWIGRFDTAEMAAKEYNKAAILYHGDFANSEIRND
jgi:hypothetical protein